MRREVAFCIELEAVELLIWDHFLDGRGTGLQVHAMQSKLNVQYYELLVHDERKRQLVAPVTVLESPWHALDQGYVLARFPDS